MELKAYIKEKGSPKVTAYGQVKFFMLLSSFDEKEEYKCMIELNHDHDLNDSRITCQIGDLVRVTYRKNNRSDWISVTLKRDFEVVDTSKRTELQNRWIQWTSIIGKIDKIGIPKPRSGTGVLSFFMSVIKHDETEQLCLVEIENQSDGRLKLFKDDIVSIKGILSKKGKWLIVDNENGEIYCKEKARIAHSRVISVPQELILEEETFFDEREDIDDEFDRPKNLPIIDVEGADVSNVDITDEETQKFKSMIRQNVRTFRL